VNFYFAFIIRSARNLGFLLLHFFADKRMLAVLFIRTDVKSVPLPQILGKRVFGDQAAGGIPPQRGGFCLIYFFPKKLLLLNSPSYTFNLPRVSKSGGNNPSGLRTKLFLY